jgi:hypothetical protein
MPVSEVIPQTNKRLWSFIQKWILCQAVRPYVMEEVFTKLKALYNATLLHPSETAHHPSSLCILLQRCLTQESMEQFGIFNWDLVHRMLSTYIDSPECPLCYDHITAHDGNTHSFSKVQSQDGTSVLRDSAQGRSIMNQAPNKCHGDLLPRMEQ